MSYAALTVELPEHEAERLESLLWDCGATGLEIRDREAPPMPGVRGAAPGEAIVLGYFTSADEADEAAAQVKTAFSSARIARTEQPDEDWSVAWRRHIRAVDIGRMWVGPPWERERAPAGKIAIVIEPKMAFGTGDHPTTSLCLEALDALMTSNPGASVLDVGTGSGVLAIAARKLGAGRIVGVDVDAMSIELAKENVDTNQAEPIELSTTPLQAVSGEFDIVLANILANTLIELAPEIAKRTRKRLALAGVLSHQRAEVAQAFVRTGLVDCGGRAQGEWVRLDFEHP